jgi:hypothetical protein
LFRLGTSEVEAVQTFGAGELRCFDAPLNQPDVHAQSPIPPQPRQILMIMIFVLGGTCWIAPAWHTRQERW